MNTDTHTGVRRFLSEIMNRTALFGVVFFMLLSAIRVSAQINVTPAQTAALLAQKLAGQGVVVQNPVLKCSPLANGIFSVVSSNLGLDSGIVLTTGRAATVPGYYGVNGPSEALASTPIGSGGDSSLNVLAGQHTLDACALEFDVIPAGDTVSIDYVFSSEEYISAVCGPYNDAFAFFISGPGITGADNMALVPGTAIPVTINSINNGVPGSTGNIANCTAMGPGSPFTDYYRDNANGMTLTHRGMTSVLRAMHTVIPCKTYHFKIVIADAGNDKFDSGVFLEAGSLTTGSYKVAALPAPVPDSAAVCIKGCLPGKFRARVDKVKNTPQVLHYTTSGSAVSGVDYSTMPDSVIIPAYASYVDIPVYGLPTPLAGLKKLDITIYSPSVCQSTSFAADSASLYIYDTMHISATPSDTSLCRGDSTRLSVSGEDIYTYSWVPDAGISSANTRNPLVAPRVSTVYTVTAYIPFSSCPLRSDTVRYNVRNTPLITIPSGTVICYNTPALLSGTVVGADSAYSYLWQGPQGYSAATSVAYTSSLTANAVFTLTVTNDTNGCKASSMYDVTLNIPAPPVVTSPVYYCQSVYPVAAVPAEGHSLRWYDSSKTALPATPVPPVDNIANYQYYVADEVNGCQGPSASVLVKVEKCCDGDIFIPTAFTPNNDGLNDRFRPLPDFSYTLKSIEIFNRWGQVVYSSSDGGWDGRFSGTDAPVGTYFYHITFNCILGGLFHKSGEFTLIR